MYIIKLIFFIFIIIIFAFIFFPVLLIFYPWRRIIGPRLLQIASRIFLSIFRVKIEHAGRIDPSLINKKGFIIISNHVNLVDIFLLSALYGTVFVSKIEVMYYPLFGQIGSLMGMIFLKRDSPIDRHAIIRTVADKCTDRIIVIFPQGTTSSLRDPLPFKCGIFKAVEINRDMILLPVTIIYKEDNDIAWTRGQLLFDNLKKICMQRQIHANVKFHKEISINDYNDKTISEVCRMAEERILGDEYIK